MNNQFMLLSHTQFIENRVYDEDEEDERATSQNHRSSTGLNKDITNKKQAKDPETAFIDSASMALKASVHFIDGAFHQVEVSAKHFLSSFCFICYPYKAM